MLAMASCTDKLPEAREGASSEATGKSGKVLYARKEIRLRGIDIFQRRAVFIPNSLSFSFFFILILFLLVLFSSFLVRRKALHETMR
jgi:hypothetical protein